MVPKFWTGPHKKGGNGVMRRQGTGPGSSGSLGKKGGNHEI